ncbi:hypothetical protein V3390_07845 [Luteimonas sp. FXH3W]|uniref:Uncharacterized protein n=1 Tax=Aquilutibacter rugosus TaxID=3115820 RepID=A0ABU7V059_9GAMM
MNNTDRNQLAQRALRDPQVPGRNQVSQVTDLPLVHIVVRNTRNFKA